MKIKIDIKSRLGSLLFSYKTEENTIKKTLLEAIKTGADLSSADLSGTDLSSADLSYADLSSAYLYGADLSGANLYCADLSSANLRSANLRSANLSGADLSSANLSSANLRSANLSGADKCSFQSFGSSNRTTTAYKDGEQINVICGCFFGTLEEFEKQVESTHGNNKYGKEYKAMIELIKIKLSTNE